MNNDNIRWSGLKGWFNYKHEHEHDQHEAEPEDRVYRQKTRRRMVILTISLALLLAMVVMVVICTVKYTHQDPDLIIPGDGDPLGASVKAMCAATQYPTSCLSSLQSANTTDPHLLFKQTLQVSSNQLISTTSNINIIIDDDERVKAALAVCQEVIHDAINNLNHSLSLQLAVINLSAKKISRSNIVDLKTWLSAAITDHETCLDALNEVNASSTIRETMKALMKNSTELISNNLAIVTKIITFLATNINNIPTVRGRRLLVDDVDVFPNWVSPADRRRLLQTVVPNLVVAKDGSGDVKTIREAIDKVPAGQLNTTTRFIIYVKAGEYLENVVLDKPNVMMYGDGKTNTIVSASLNFADGTPTFKTATFAVTGSGFIARDMGFKNTAGPSKHQAVALRSGSDKSVFYRCSMEAFQDTLYTYSLRQFYRECDIIGTVDFIFGNAAVVLQKCSILPRQPMSNQFVTITAQGKTDPNQNTGISIQGCVVSPFDNLTATTYLGRPWKNYATTVVMQTQIGSLLDPTGWSPWDMGVEPPKTIYYGEYQNTGPGANTSNRVKWAGYKPSITSTEASTFTVKSFIDGTSWLPATNVLFDSSL